MPFQCERISWKYYIPAYNVSFLAIFYLSAIKNYCRLWGDPCFLQYDTIPLFPVLANSGNKSQQASQPASLLPSSSVPSKTQTRGEEAQKAQASTTHTVHNIHWVYNLPRYNEIRQFDTIEVSVHIPFSARSCFTHWFISTFQCQQKIFHQW